MMAGFPTGVAVVTAFDGAGIPRGMTCSSLSSVGLSPPTLSVSLRPESPTLHAIHSEGAFTVNLLHAGAQPVAELFASGAADRFDRVRWSRERAFGGPALVEDTNVAANCRVAATHDVGGQTVVYGEVTHVWRLSDREPLLYGLRRYLAWPADTELGVDPGAALAWER